MIRGIARMPDGHQDATLMAGAKVFHDGAVLRASMVISRALGSEAVSFVIHGGQPGAAEVARLAEHHELTTHSIVDRKDGHQIVAGVALAPRRPGDAIRVFSAMTSLSDLAPDDAALLVAADAGAWLRLLMASASLPRPGSVDIAAAMGPGNRVGLRGGCFSTIECPKSIKLGPI